MCQLCVDLVAKHLPKIDRKDYGRLLMSATCFPFGGPELIDPQLSEMAYKTDGTLEQCNALRSLTLKCFQTGCQNTCGGTSLN